MPRSRCVKGLLPGLLVALLLSSAASADLVLPPGASGKRPSPKPVKQTFPATEDGKKAAPKSAKAPSKAKSKPKTRVKELPKLLSEVQAKYIRAGTLTADFSQVTKTAGMGTSKTSSGTILVKRPDKMRWETLQPSKNLLVSNGVKFWHYTPPFDEDERGQLVEGKAAQVQSKLANALLSGSFSELSDMKIREAGKNEFTLQPRKGTAGTIVKVFLEVDSENSLIKRVKLVHGNGNEAEITLQNIKLGEPLKEDLFQFEAPPNTERMSG